jgi:hypothetical protein
MTFNLHHGLHYDNNNNGRPVYPVDDARCAEALIEIAEAITTPGEELTDGECIDIVWGVIEKLGWDLHELMSNKTIIYNIQQKKEEK